MLNRKNYDVAITGAGVIGCSIALGLSRLGYKVCVIDRNHDAGAGTTSYSSGVCRTMYSILDSVRFSWEGYQYWSEWQDFLGIKDSRGYAKLREPGAVFLKTNNSKSFLNKCTSCLKQANIPYEEWDLQESKDYLEKYQWDINHSYNPKRINDIAFGIPVEYSIEGAVFFPKTGYVSDPQLAAQNLCLAGQLNNSNSNNNGGGVDYIFNHKVIDVSQCNGAVTGLKIVPVKPVNTNSNTNNRHNAPNTPNNNNNNTNNNNMNTNATHDIITINAPIVVNATGPHSQQFTSMVFSSNPITGRKEYIESDMLIGTRPLRQEVAYCDAPPPLGRSDTQLDMDLETSNAPLTADLDIGVYFRPEIGNKYLIGSVEPDCDEHQWVDGDIDDLDTNLSDNWTNYIYRAALRIPNLPIPTSRNSMGIVSTYDVTPDWTPIYDKSNLKGYYMAIGTSGNQFKNAGIVGELMAKLIDSCENGQNHDKNPVLFETKRTNPGQYVNLNSFSRLRVLNDTSGSVMG